MSQTYDLVMTSDENYMNYLFVLCHNILERIDKTKDNSQDKLVFHVIIDESIPLVEFEAKTKLFEQFHQDAAIAFNFETHVIKQSDLGVFASLLNYQATLNLDAFKESLTETGIKRERSLGYYYRLLMDRLLSKDISKVLYLDVDIYVYCDIREIFKVQLGDNILGVVQDTGICPQVAINDGSLSVKAYDPKQPDFNLKAKDYFNSGVMLINLVAWREHNVTERCIEAGTKWRFCYRDQTMLNIVCQNRVTYLDWYWNAPVKTYFCLSTLACNNSPQDQEKFYAFFKVPVQMQSFFDEANKTKIVHFAGDFTLKPWHYQFKINEDNPLIRDSVLFKIMNARQLWLASLQQLAPFFKACRQLPQPQKQ